MAQAFVVPHFSSSGVASELFKNTPWRALSSDLVFGGLWGILISTILVRIDQQFS